MKLSFKFWLYRWSTWTTWSKTKWRNAGTRMSLNAMILTSLSSFQGQSGFNIGGIWDKLINFGTFSQEQKCEESFWKSCKIDFKETPFNYTLKQCHTPLIKVNRLRHLSWEVIINVIVKVVSWLAVNYENPFTGPLCSTVVGQTN